MSNARTTFVSGIDSSPSSNRISVVARRGLLRAMLLVASVLVFGCPGDVRQAPDPATGQESAALNPSVSGPSCPAWSATHPPTLPRVPTVSAGTVAGSFAVGSDGAATYRMPLRVPPGRAGLEPQLALQYDSNGGEGMLGLGFQLQGFSQIARCGSFMNEDGKIREIRYDDQDHYCLDGKRLVLVAVTPGAAATEYRTLPDTFAKVSSPSATPAIPTPGRSSPRTAVSSTTARKTAGRFAA
jgi:hypothetical protein